jgi:hypothetical protein
VYSSQIEVTNYVFLREVDKSEPAALELLAGIAKKLGKISKKDFGKIMKGFFSNCALKI